MDKRKNKMCYVHIMEYYSVLKRKKILTHATTWVSLEDTVLSEISQLQKDKYCMIPLTCGIRNSQIKRDQICGYQRWGAGGGGIR